MTDGAMRSFDDLFGSLDVECFRTVTGCHLGTLVGHLDVVMGHFDPLVRLAHAILGHIDPVQWWDFLWLVLCLTNTT